MKNIREARFLFSFVWFCIFVCFVFRFRCSFLLNAGQMQDSFILQVVFCLQVTRSKCRCNLQNAGQLVTLCMLHVTWRHVCILHILHVCITLSQVWIFWLLCVVWTKQTYDFTSSMSCETYVCKYENCNNEACPIQGYSLWKI